MVQELVQTGNPYVYLRRKTYYFRVLIPQHLRELCPSLPREIKRSLRTDSLTDALAMVSDKIPLIRLLRNSKAAEVALEIYQKLSNFNQEIFGWVKSKLATYELPERKAISPPVLTNKTPNSLKLDKAWSDFVNWKKWTDKQAKANQRIYDNLRLYLGDVTIHEVTKRGLKEALRGISGLPQRNKKSYKQLPLEALKELSIPAEDRVSNKYVKEHLKLCQSLFNRYLKQEVEVLHVSPTEGIKWEHENNRFGCFSDTEIKRIISQVNDKPEWFKWFTMLTIYSGARRSEVARLTKDDFKFCPDTLRHYFVIKEGKTKAARRAIPVHTLLIKKGLLLWIENSPFQLFDIACHNPNRVSDLFSTLLERKQNDYGERLVFHSLRHTFITKARAAGISNVLVQQVVGHEKRGAGQTDRYTHTFQLKDVLKVIDAISYQ